MGRGQGEGWFGSLSLRLFDFQRPPHLNPLPWGRGEIKHVILPFELATYANVSLPEELRFGIQPLFQLFDIVPQLGDNTLGLELQGVGRDFACVPDA